MAKIKTEKELQPNYQHGLVTAHTGSVYDVATIADDSTKASENGDNNSYNISRRFTQTEKAVRKHPFKTFYTTNLTDYDGEVDSV